MLHQTVKAVQAPCAVMDSMQFPQAIETMTGEMSQGNTHIGDQDRHDQL